MNRFLSIFGFFRHGRAERTAMRRDPFFLFRTFAPDLIEETYELEKNHLHAPVIAHWVFESESLHGLRLRWAVSSEGGRES